MVVHIAGRAPWGGSNPNIHPQATQPYGQEYSASWNEVDGKRMSIKIVLIPTTTNDEDSRLNDPHVNAKTKFVVGW